MCMDGGTDLHDIQKKHRCTIIDGIVTFKPPLVERREREGRREKITCME